VAWAAGGCPGYLRQPQPVAGVLLRHRLLLRRHDYRVDVAGGFAAIQYVYDVEEADGIKVPTKRRAFRCDTDGRLLPDELMVSVDVNDIRFTR
jgi:hypothetical protein